MALVAASSVASGAGALERVELRVGPGGEGLERALRSASLLLEAEREGRTLAQDVFAAAQAEYGRLLGVLYAQGHYSGVISVRIDGREAAEIPALNAPGRIGTVVTTVTPGPAFSLGRAEVVPLAPGTDLSAGFVTGAPAPSPVVRDAVSAAVAGWRDAGHPKAAAGRQDITADHANARLDARVEMVPGPRAVLGRLGFAGQERMRESRLRAIAGFPQGEVFSPAAIARSADRLRRTGAFRSIAMTEAERIGPDGALDVTATLIEEAPRRIGFGAELGSLDGLSLSAFWLHRNLFGGAERLRVEGAVSQIGASRGGTDYRLGVSFERPATFTPDTSLGLSFGIERKDEEDHKSDQAAFGLRLSHVFSDRLSGRVGLEYRHERVRDRLGTTPYRTLALPVGMLRDTRDTPLDARRGSYLDVEVMPFLGFGSTDSGARLKMDARAYRALGERVVLAGRVQVGAIAGASLLGTPRDYLFYSGGGGTVRGQPFQSLGVFVLRNNQRTGGTKFLAASGEIRGRITDTIGVVGFYDIGHVSAQRFFDGSGSWHAGAGIGLRYATGIGPIRLDVAGPVRGNTGRGVQVYLGIGQAF